MFRFLGKLIFVVFLAALIFAGISAFWGGGEKIRWLGKKVEHMSQKAGEEADRLKAKSDKLLKSVGINIKTGGKTEEKTEQKTEQKTKEPSGGKKNEKSH